MKIVVIYGSARKNGTSAKVSKKILDKVRTPGDDVQEYWLAEQHIKPCIGCMACRKSEVCSQKGDDMEKIYQDIISADFVIFSSPLYCLDVSGAFKLMFDRLYPMVAGPQGRYTARHPGIKCCMVLTQGAPTIKFSDTAKRMRIRLKTNGFQNLGVIRCGMGLDLTKESERIRKIGTFYLKRQEKRNERQISEIVQKVKTHK